MDALATLLTGTCAFRLMPSDELADAPSSAAVARLGTGLSIAYSWHHAVDGEQRGALVIGGPDERGSVEASWFDSWHQQPGLMTLPGRRVDDRIELTGTYAEEWGWTITIGLSDSEVSMTMCNVIPASALADRSPDKPAVEAGPYDVMVARWQVKEMPA